MTPEIAFALAGFFSVTFIAFSKSGLAAGIGMAGLPILALVMPVSQTAGVLLPILLLMDAISVWAYRRDVDWGLLRILLPGGLIGTGIGWLVASIVPEAAVLLMVALIILIFVADSMLPLRRWLGLNAKDESKAARRSLPKGLFWSTLSGFVSFLVLAGGPPFQIYTLPLKLPPVRLAATAAWYFAIINIAKIVPFFLLGQLTPGNLQLSALLAPVAIVMMLVGIALVRRISARQYYAIAYTVVTLVAFKLLYDGLSRLFGI